MEIYVAPDGNDSWSGLLPAPNRAKTDGPLASLHSVAARLECFVAGRSIHPAQFSVKEPPAGPVTVYLRGGVYALEKPLVLGPQHSFPVTFKAYRKEKPVISGARRITQWRKGAVNGKTAWIADLPEVAEGKWSFRELYVNGKRAARPRLPGKGLYGMKELPDAVLPTGRDGHYSRFICNPGDVRAFRNLKDVEVVYVHAWIEERSAIASFSPEANLVTMERPSVFKPVWGSTPADYYLDNVYEALARPGQWYLDRAAGKLYYLPLRGETPRNSVVYAPRCLQLIGLVGNPGERKFVEHIKFEGITFAYTDWRHPDVSDGVTDIVGQEAQPAKSFCRRLGRGNYAASAQAASDVPGVISKTGARYCAVENCTI